MKRNLLVVLFALIYTIGSAQVVFYVQPDSPLEGTYTITYADVNNGWGADDMTDPANAVIGEMVMAYDETAADSLCCEEPIVTDVDGKVAVLYRGACNFSLKALNVQNAGAIACVIINHSGEPVGMGAGDYGADVTIPTVMISTDDGALLRPAIEAGGLDVFIGNKNGFYQNDLGFTAGGVIRAPQFSSIELLSQGGDEFFTEVGGWVYNYGSSDATNVVFWADIWVDGDNPYSETSEAFDLASGDSAWVMLPSFSMDVYPVNFYDLDYTVTSDSTDDFPSDDTFEANFAMSDSLFTYTRMNNEMEGPFNMEFYRPSTVSGEVRQCVAFVNENGSRVGAKGLTFAATSATGTTIDGEVVDLYMYEWTALFDSLNSDDYEGILDDDLDLLTTGLYEYVGEDMQGENVYAEFEDQLILDDETRYLFCIAYTAEDFFTGFDAPKNDYEWTLETYLQPQFPNTAGGDWFLVGFGTDIVPGIAVHFFDADPDAIDENGKQVDVTPYPNPTADMLMIPVKDANGTTTVQIFDIAGKLVNTQRVSTVAGELMRLDVSDLDNGIYTVGLRYENGNVSNFNIVVSK